MSLYLHRHDTCGIAVATAQDDLKTEVAKLDDRILSHQRPSEFIHAESLNAAHRKTA